MYDGDDIKPLSRQDDFGISKIYDGMSVTVPKLYICITSMYLDIYTV